MQMGYVRIKNSATIEAGDLSLRTIKGVVIQQYAHRDAVGGLSGVFGSVNTRGSLMNSVTITALKGSGDPTTGTTHQGTIKGGTQQVSFLVFGA
jgi:hypothetical protein